MQAARRGHPPFSARTRGGRDLACLPGGRPYAAEIMGHVLRIPTPTRRGRIALVVVVSLLAAACSGTPSASPATPATPTPTAAASTPAGETSAPTQSAEPTPAPTPILAGPLAVVAALVGDDTATVSFSDWDRMRGDAPTRPRRTRRSASS